MPIEQQLLPSASLKPTYRKVAWLYNNRNFDNSPADRTAERIELRFGISSYPHLLIVDPEKLTVLAELGRTEKDLLNGFARTIKVANAKAAAEKLRQAEDRVAKLEKANTAAAAKKGLTDEDIVVRFTALQMLVKQEPKAVAAKATELLEVPNDNFRYQVCVALTQIGDKSAAKALEKLAADPKSSMNPNVLRIRAVEALAKCGTEESVAVVARFASTGDVNNGLTSEAIEALAEIAARVPKAKTGAKDALVRSYPPAGGSATGEKERSLALAQKVHQQLTKLTGKKVMFPTVYDEAARTKLMKSW